MFKLFNRIETWKLLDRELGGVTWRAYDFDQFDGALSAALGCGERIHSAACIVPPPQFGRARKHQNHLRLIEHMMASDLPDRVHTAPDLKSVYQVLRSFPTLGPLLAGQLAIDLNYTALVDHSEMEFVVPGPAPATASRSAFATPEGWMTPMSSDG